MWNDEERAEWVNRYFNKAFGTQINNKLLVKLNNIKYNKISELGALYRYRNTTDVKRIIESLKNGIAPKLWFSYPDEFNDPFDTWYPNILTRVPHSLFDRINKCCYSLFKLENIDYLKKIECLKRCSKCINSDNSVIIIRNIVDIIAEYCKIHSRNEIFDLFMDGILNPFIDRYKEIQHRSGIASFSETPYSILMWSHYSENHKGICLEYSADKMDNFLLPNKHKIIEYIHPVRYCNDLYDQADELYQLILSKKKFKEDYKRNERFIIINILTKYINWNYEREWRAIVTFSQPRSTLNLDRYLEIKPDCIYLGAKIEKSNETELRHQCDINDIVIKKMYMADNMFELIALDM